MNVKLTESMIRKRANAQSYERGIEYYNDEAIYDTHSSVIPGGVRISASCSGSDEYLVQAEITALGIGSTSCTCPYDWGGDCKHIIALLLTYLNQMDEFMEKKSVSELLEGLNRDELVALVAALAQDIPQVYEELMRSQPDKAEGPARVIVVPLDTPLRQAPAAPETQVSENVYRKLVKKTLQQKPDRYDNYYDDYEEAPAYLEDLEEIAQTALQTLNNGDAAGALIIMRVLLEETIDEYDSDDDYDGDVSSFLQDLGIPVAEAILTLDPNEDERARIHDDFEEILENLEGILNENGEDVILAALKYGWDELEESELAEEGRDTHAAYKLLCQARLNVFERQGRVEEFLRLAKKVDPYRRALKLIQIGRVDEAVEASAALASCGDILEISQKLRVAGRSQAALELAERGLDVSDGDQGKRYELARWLGGLEEAGGNTQTAVRAYSVAFAVRPEIGLYRQIKSLSGAGWEGLRPALVANLKGSGYLSVMVDIHLEEKNWDAAISIAEANLWSDMLGRVADAVTAVRPDWVQRIALKKVNDLVAPTQSKLYPEAASWLERMKRAYHARGQTHQWQSYINDFRASYARRPALMKAIEKL